MTNVIPLRTVLVDSLGQMSEQAKRPKLTGILKEIAGVIGFEATLELCKARGGTLVYIPASVSGGHWLSKAIGLDRAEKLAQHFSSTAFNKTDVRITRRGERIQLPIGPRSAAALPAGSTREVALQLGIHQRTVQRRRAREILVGES